MDVASPCPDGHVASRRLPNSVPRRLRRRLSRHRKWRSRRRERPWSRGPTSWRCIDASSSSSSSHDATSEDSSAAEEDWNERHCYVCMPSRRLNTDRHYYSDTATVNMPVGFENSSMKMSFSLSSLQPSSASLESPEHARLRSERQYNSLTKKPRKTPEQESWRRSWGSRDDNKDEFWAALQPNYNYLMDNHLIDSCNEANGELSSRDASDESFLVELQELKNQFTELYAWLNNVQDGVYGKEENVTDRSLRVSHMEEMQRNSFRRQSFNEKSSSLLEQSPKMSDEVSWRVSHLNSKWEMLEQVLTPVKSNPNQADTGTDVEHEVRCLRKWLSEMETRLQPLDFRTTDRWTHQELDEKAREHMVLQRDVESHGKIVCSVVRLCERVARTKQRRGGRRRDTQDTLGVARSLESRWHHLFLRSLEWSCMIEALADKLRNNSPSLTGTDSDEGPASKYPRLSQSADLSTLRTASSSSSSSHSDVDRRHPEGASSSEDDVDLMDTSNDATSLGNMVGPMVKGGKKRRSGVSREEIRALEERVASPRLLDGSVTKGSDGENCVVSTTRRSGSNFNRENREAPNYATFYFKHLDTDSEQDARQKDLLVPGQQSSDSSNDKFLEESSEEEWTFTNGNTSKLDTSGSSSETATSLRRALHDKKNSVAVRLDFGGDPVEMSVDEDTHMLVNENNQNVRDVGDVEVSRKVPWKSSRESIQRLVRCADEMVMSPNKISAVSRATRNFEPLVFGDLKPACHEAKTARIKEWLDLHPQEDHREHPVDSCDASGEYTTGDSDDDEKVSQSSEDQNVSVATCRQVDQLLGCSRSGSSDAILEVEGDTTSPLRTPTHVVMRSKRRQADRPWSVSGVPPMVEVSATGQPLAHFSTSESALNHMVRGFPQTNGTSPQGKGPNMGSGLMNVSSSTIDGTHMAAIPGDLCSGSGAGSLRRRKLRLKKRTMGRKSESGSDGVTVGHSNSGGSDNPQSPTKQITPCFAADTSPRQKAILISGQTRKIISASDSMLRDSSSDEEERVSRRVIPSFKLGPDGGSVSFPDKKTILGVDEHHSALSEQAWDNYQEKYMSEPYSEELADTEAARRLLEFGDDYRNFLDSQSDCASSLSANQVSSPSMRRRKPAGNGDCNRLDSDSDLDDIRHVIKQSHSQLVFTEHVFGKQLANASPQLILATDFAEIVATCRENINCLRLILDNVEEDDAGLLSANECKEIRGLIERWEMLQVNSEDLQRVRGLQREMVALKDELLNLASRVDGMETNLQDREQLECRISQIKVELSSLRDRKAKLLDVNVAVHRFLTDTGHPAAVLKDDVADLYRIWDETFQSVSQRLSNLQKVSTTWQQFDSHLSELQIALRGDHDTLRMLDTALQDGEVTSDVATSIMDVAKVLSEKQERYHEALCQKPTTLNDSATSTNTTLVSTPLSTEGSLSDSGISDEGSEQELSERERRLEALRRLARHLEGVLAPGSAVLVNMAKRIEQTENELRNLQSTCRDLIVRTAVCVEAKAHLSSSPSSAVAAPLVITPRQKTTPRSRKSSASRRHTLRLGVSPDDDDPDKRRSWLWRVMRTALPFQMALVALFCVVCLLEPHCCDAMNSLNLSLTPQLRYLRGPPPV